MRLLNIVTQYNDHDIVVLFETLSFFENEQEEIWYNHKKNAGHVLHRFLDLFNRSYPMDAVAFQKELQITELIAEEPDFFIELNYQNKPFLSRITSIHYRLPHHRLMALDFLAAIDAYLENREFDHTVLSDSVLYEKVSEGQLIQPLENLLARSLPRQQVTQRLTATILSWQCSLPLYRSTLDALAKVDHFARQQGKSFSECLDMKNRYLILYTSANKLLASPLDHYSQIRMLIEMTQSLLTYRKVELIHLVDNLGLEAKKRFFRPAIGQLAHDKGHYTWNYTEWWLFSDAEFTLRQDGCLAMDMPGNPAYRDIYAKGKPNHAIIEQELTFLKKYLPLEFHPKTDFHKTIIFSPKCSALLLQQGVHLNKSYIQKLLKMKNAMTFFGKQKENPAASPDARRIYENLLRLPLEITALIMGYSFPELAETLHKNDLIELMHYTNAQADFRLARQTVKANEEPSLNLCQIV